MRFQKLLCCLFLPISAVTFAQKMHLSDPQATKETQNLYRNLKKLSVKAYLFGQQDALAYGVTWKYQDGRSDVKDITGDQPGLVGWDLSHIENGSAVNIDTVPFIKIKQYIRKSYAKGAAVTISWHGNNPMTGKTAWDPEPGTVASILPGGSKHKVFTAQLDKIAAFLGRLKGSHGEAIPVLYRPFHEFTGSWFWWGTKDATPEQFKQLYRFTVNYLRKTKHLHNLIIIYNTGTEFNNSIEYLARYPGDDVVDMLTFDTYERTDPATDKSFATDLSTRLSVIEKIARDKNKIAALGEVGYNGVPYATWWTGVLAPALEGHHIAYVLLWRNAGYKSNDKSTEYYVPYKGQVSEADFVKFYQLPQTIFEKDAGRLKLYN